MRIQALPETIAAHITDKTGDNSKITIQPTGSVQRKSNALIAEIAEDKDIAVLSDEVYGFHSIRDRISPRAILLNVITVNAVSKTYAMTGWRLGYLVARGCALEQLLKIHQYVQACASSVSQMAALAAVTGPQDCVAQMRDEFRNRRDLMVSGFQEMGVDLVVPEGAFYLFPRVGDGDVVAARLSSAGVIVVPGSAFGPGGKEYIRLSYAAARSQLEVALARMKDIL
jgi:aspartate aminotransferase